MPSETFFRWPEEKRRRIIDAAWDEFTSVSFDQVSINRIIRAADIPRGSFYQYFEDKSDLFRYLADGVKQYALEGYLSVLRANRGDLFFSMLDSFDQLRKIQGLPDIKPVDNAIAFLRINPGLDIQAMIARDASWLDPVWEQVDLRHLKQPDLRYLQTVFPLCLLTLANAALDSLAHSEHWDRNREWFICAIDILRYGCMAPDA